MTKREQLEGQFDTKAYLKRGNLNPTYVDKIENEVFNLLEYIDELKQRIDSYYEAPKKNIFTKIKEMVSK